MKKILGLMAGIALMGSVYAQSSSLAIGSSLPAEGYQMTDVFSGATPKLQDVQTKKGLLVIFTCNTCPFVIKNIKRTAEVLEYARKKGVGIMLVNSNEAQRGDVDAPAEMIAFGKKQNYTSYYVDKDAALATAFGASHTPEVFLFDGKTSKLVYKGAMDDNPSDPDAAKTMFLKDAIDNMFAGKTINPDVTKSVGCSIKKIKKS